MDNRFRFELPKGWQDQTVYYFIGPDIDGTGHQMILTLDRTLQQDEIGMFARKKTDPIVNSLGGLEVMKDEEVTLEGGNPAYEFVCKWVPSDQMTVIKMFVFVFYDDTGFSFSCDFSRKSYKMLGSQFRKIVEDLLPGTFEEIG